MKRSLAVALKFLVSIPASLVVGGYAYQVVAQGTWVIDALGAALSDTAMHWVSAILGTLFIVVIFIALQIFWVFEKPAPGKKIIR